MRNSHSSECFCIYIRERHYGGCINSRVHAIVYIMFIVPVLIIYYSRMRMYEKLSILESSKSMQDGFRPFPHLFFS